MSVLKLYNPDAHADNTIVIHEKHSGCCGSDNQICAYVMVETIVDVTAITINVNGSPEVVTFPAVSTPKDVRVALAAALASKGYDPYYKDNWKGITVEPDKIIIIGDVEVVSITNDGTVEAAVKKCTIGKVLRSRGTVEVNTDPGLLSLDGAAGTQIGLVGGYASGNAAGLKAALIVAAGTQTVALENVIVTENTPGLFVYEIHHTAGVLTADGVELTELASYADYISA
jgi:hypothetical protein